MMRASVIEVLDADHVRTARAKGLSPRLVLRRHVFRNALIPTTTVLGLQIGALLAGNVLTEVVFNWPGIGLYAVNAIKNLDYPAIMGVTLVISVIYVFVNLLVDIAYVILDPRISLGGAACAMSEIDSSISPGKSLLVAPSSPRGKPRSLLRRLLANPLSAAGLIFVCIAIVVAVLAPEIAPYDPVAMVPENRLAPPSAEHWFGDGRRWPRHPFAHYLRHAVLASGRARHPRHGFNPGHDCRSSRRNLRWLGRRDANANHRHVSCISCPCARHGASSDTWSQPIQCDNRHGGGVVALVCKVGAWADAAAQTRGIRRGGADRWRLKDPHCGPSHPA
jgi:ABC-type dipeptide/oligopeptide/nickel transport systems, permease components